MSLIQKMLLLVVVSLVTATSGYAEIKLTGRHELVAVHSNRSGSLLTFRVIISNSGISTLSKARIVATDPLIVPDTASNVRVIENLPSGQSIAFNWNVGCEFPSDQLTPGMEIPLVLQVEAFDEKGGISEFYISSTVTAPKYIQVSKMN